MIIKEQVFYFLFEFKNYVYMFCLYYLCKKVLKSFIIVLELKKVKYGVRVEKEFRVYVL